MMNQGCQQRQPAMNTTDQSLGEGHPNDLGVKKLIRSDLEQATGGAAPVIDRLARFGFAAKGIVTITIGVLALRYALGWGGTTAGPQQALEALFTPRFGAVVLGLIGVGLAGHAFWLLVQAIVDPEGKGTGFQAIAERVAFLITAIGYGMLAYAAIRLLLGEAGVTGAGLGDLAAEVLTPRVGRWFVGVVGGIVMTAGLLQLRFGITARFRRTLRADLSRTEWIGTVATGMLGYVTLGALSLLVGYSLVQVALRYDPEVARGWDEVFGFLANLPHGPWLVGAVATGLIFYGFYFVLLVRYRSL